MDKIITYSDLNSQIDERIRKKKVIPYSVYPGERFRKGKWYYSRYYNNFFKVLEVNYEDNGELEYAVIKTDDNRYSRITTDICTDDLIVVADTTGIYKSYIFNSNIPYSGAEIRYWFFMHNIDCLNEKYTEFWKYVDKYSPCRLDERKKYRCYATLDVNGNISKCRVKEYTTKLVADREQANKDYHEKDLEFLKKDMKKHSKKLKKKKNKKTPRK